MTPFARALPIALAAATLTTTPAAAQPPRGKVYVLVALDTACALARGTLPDGSGFTLGDLSSALREDSRVLQEALKGGIGRDFLVVKELDGKNVTRAKVEAAIRGFGVTGDDALVVFFGGHGATDERSGKHCLFMSGSRTIEKVPREDVRRVMTARSPRLAVLLTDACSNKMDLLSAPPRSTLNVQAARVAEVRPGFRKLFFESRGVVDVNAAFLGTYAWSHDKRGSVFVHGLDAAFADLEQNPGRAGWARFYLVAKQATEDTFEKWKAEELGAARARGLRTADALVGQERQTTQAFHLTGTRLKVFTLDTGKGGLEVFEVLEDGPWHRAGLKVGDVILEANGQPVPDQAAWDRVVSGPLDQGRFPTRFVVRRDGTEKTVTARP